jgi:magnesium and cobalt transporter
MGDISEGSSAAHGAQDPEQTGQQGFFSRILSALSPQPESIEAVEAREVAEARASGSTAMPLPGLVNLRRMRVDDISTPKADIIAVPVDISRADLVQAFKDSGFSRLPVYDDEMDKPLGLVLLKDFALKFGFGADESLTYDLRAMLRPLIYAPPSMALGVLLQKMQTERIHMALIIDEHGGVDGLVTIEDLIEQVIGEIEDEHDTGDGGSWVVEKPGVYLALARTPLDEFEAEIGLRLLEDDEEEIDTLGGLVYLLAGKLPVRGETVRHASGVEFDVIDADPRRIKRLRVRLPEGMGKAA